MSFFLIQNFFFYKPWRKSNVGKYSLPNESAALPFLSFQQAPVGGNLHLQVLFDAQELLVVRLGALHVKPELREVFFQLVQGDVQTLHVGGVLLIGFSQVRLQGRNLRVETEATQDGNGSILFFLLIVRLQNQRLDAT